MLYPQRRICYVAMVQAEAEAKYDALHQAAPFHDGTFTKWSKDRTALTPFHYREGVSIWVADTDLTPHDHFLGGAGDCDECRPDEDDEDEEVADGRTP